MGRLYATRFFACWRFDRRSAYVWCDFAAGYRAQDALRSFLATEPVLIDRQGADRYGRMLARVTVNGRDAGEYLVRLGLARRWR